MAYGLPKERKFQSMLFSVTPHEILSNIDRNLTKRNSAAATKKPK